MTAIRPDLSLFAPRPPATPSGAQDTAQAAFFRMALGQATPSPAASPQSVQANPAVPAAQTPPSPPAVDPERPLRPGSLLDIRV